MQMSFWQDGMQEFIRTLILGKHGYKKITGKKCLGSASNTLISDANTPRHSRCNVVEAGIS